MVQRRNPHELLESVIEPSRKIEPQFAETIIVTSKGKTFQGRIFHETNQFVVLSMSNSFAEPISIPKSDIDERLLTHKSTMPAGLLNSLEKQQILDLLAYVISDGNAQHTAFQTKQEKVADQP